MDRGTYISASAGLFNLRKVEIVNNNLANVNTPGFKRQILTGDEQTFDQTLAKAFKNEDPFAKADQDRTPGVVNIKTETDFSQGPMLETGRDLDVALSNPKDFFVVNTPEGPVYTRAGNFSLDAEGNMTTVDGFPVSGDGGPISVTAPGVSITPNGAVRAQGLEFGKLKVVRFEDTSGLERIGASRFKVADGGPAPVDVEPQVLPKSLEMANVSAITSMVDLIIASRGFQAYTRTSETIDQLNQTAINQIGRPRS